jgi:hypothetical protein
MPISLCCARLKCGPQMICARSDGSRPCPSRHDPSQRRFCPQPWQGLEADYGWYLRVQAGMNPTRFTPAGLSFRDSTSGGSAVQAMYSSLCGSKTMVSSCY